MLKWHHPNNPHVPEFRGFSMDATCSSSCLHPRVRQFSEPWNVSTHSDLQVLHVSEVPGFFDVLMHERHTVSLHFRRGAVFQQFQIVFPTVHDCILGGGLKLKIVPISSCSWRTSLSSKCLRTGRHVFSLHFLFFILGKPGCIKAIKGFDVGNFLLVCFDI